MNILSQYTTIESLNFKQNNPDIDELPTQNIEIQTNQSVDIQLGRDLPAIRSLLTLEIPYDEKKLFSAKIVCTSILEYDEWGDADSILNDLLRVAIPAQYNHIRTSLGNITIAAGFSAFLGPELSVIMEQISSSEYREQLLNIIKSKMKHLGIN